MTGSQPQPRITLIDNQDSFVYNLVDAFAFAGYPCTVFRNTVPVQHVLFSRPDLIVLSPGPGHPRQAGITMPLLDAAIRARIPVLGVCLGFQAMLEHYGVAVEACGPVHGHTDHMRLTEAGIRSRLFHGLAITGTVNAPAADDPTAAGNLVPVARYHSLGAIEAPPPLEALAWCGSDIGDIVMAARSRDGLLIGLQFHPESVLSPTGPIILERCVTQLLEGRTGGTPESQPMEKLALHADEQPTLHAAKTTSPFGSETGKTSSTVADTDSRP